MRPSSLYKFLTSAFVVLLALFLVVPVAIIIPSSFAAVDQLVFPPAELSMRWYKQIVSDGQWLTSAALSLKVAIGAVVIAVPVALIAAVAAVRFGALSGFRRLYVLLPLVVPHSVIATGLFAVVLKLKVLGNAGVLAVVHASFALPLALLLFIGALEAIDPLVWSAAATLGATPRRVLSNVILRTMWPSVLSATLLVFIFSWDETVAAVFVGPVAPPTLPALMFTYLQQTVTPVVAAVASTLLVISVIVGAAMLRLSGRNASRSIPGT